MAKAENMLQTGHAGRLMWIKFRQMIHSVFLRDARFAAAAQQNAVWRFKVQFVAFAMREISATMSCSSDYSFTFRLTSSCPACRSVSRKIT